MKREKKKLINKELPKVENLEKLCTSGGKGAIPKQYQVGPDKNAASLQQQQQQQIAPQKR